MATLFDQAKALQDAQGALANLRQLRTSCQQVQTLMTALTTLATVTWPAAIAAGTGGVTQADLDALLGMLTYWNAVPEVPQSAAQTLTAFLATTIGQ